MTYHEGELEMQARAGVKTMAARIARGIYSAMPPIAQEFLEEQRFAVAASVDTVGQVWASPLVGEAGFLIARDAHTIQIETQPLSGDPLFANLAHNPQIGLLVIDFLTRQRSRFNGTAKAHSQGLVLHVEQAYANCPKYIQVRAPLEVSRAVPQMHQGDGLSTAQQTWIAQADTFFIASAHATGGADASHRGGTPGFVHVLDAQTLEFPDYAGNMMFNTLGNLTANPHAGLLFVDFDSGATLQLTGTTNIHWEPEHLALFSKAERVIRFHVEQVIEISNVIPFQFTFLQASPHNPPASF
jgi:predicted pyridoxine 5'-phosphate oxidase superfamily flavin-nucleotide-binding protein